MLAQYLSRHAEPEVALADAIDGSFEHVITVPACDERVEGVLGLLAECGDPSVLSIVVVNGAAHHPAELHTRNAVLLQQLIEQTAAEPLKQTAVEPRGPVAWWGQTQQSRWLIVDRCSEGRLLGRRKGVGTARRIAGDIACALWHQGKLGQRFIHMSDADARLPADYFRAATQHPDAVALTYPFRHRPSGDDALDRAHAIYELYLRYYVLGLRHARSPYAMHTIGSTLAIDALTYAQVRGVPPRQAAEDFYLLNKVAKLGPIRTPDCAPIALLARPSERVPFGTGRAVDSIVSAGQRWDSYHPDIFVVLRAWLAALAQHCVEAPPEQLVERSLAQVTGEIGAELSGLLRDAVGQLGTAALARALRGAPAHQRAARLSDWLDAFRTRKLVHALRDGGLGCVRWWQALRAPFCGLSLAADTPTPELWRACELLAQREAGAVA